MLAVRPRALLALSVSLLLVAFLWSSALMTRPPWVSFASGIVASDKVGHFAMSTLLGLSFYAVLQTLTSCSTARMVIMVLSAGLLVSVVSETLQMFSPGRDALSSFDILSDALGLVLSTSLTLVFIALKNLLQKVPRRSPL